MRSLVSIRIAHLTLGATALDPSFEPPEDIPVSTSGRTTYPQPSTSYVPQPEAQQFFPFTSPKPVPHPSSPPTFYRSASFSFSDLQDTFHKSWIYNFFRSFALRTPTPQAQYNESPMDAGPADPQEAPYGFSVYPVEPAVPYVPFDPTHDFPTGYHDIYNGPAVQTTQFIPIDPIPAVYTQPPPITQVFPSDASMGYASPEVEPVPPEHPVWPNPPPAPHRKRGSKRADRYSRFST
jgi:hypothetical protein